MLIKAENITHSYSGGAPVLSGVDIAIEEMQTVGLLGQSGSGKTTLGQILSGLLRPTDGTVYFHENEVKFPFRGTPRSKIQILFQHPEISFNPRLTIFNSLKEIYKLYRIPFSEETLLEALEEFGIYKEHLHRFPTQLSGGEIQRIALYRILLPEPECIILDEPTSMLDVISQAQIMQMLKRLQQKRRISYLLITHDEYLCEVMSEKIYRINKGNICKEERK